MKGAFNRPIDPLLRLGSAKLAISNDYVRRPGALVDSVPCQRTSREDRPISKTSITPCHVDIPLIYLP